MSKPYDLKQLLISILDYIDEKNKDLVVNDKNYYNDHYGDNKTPF